MFSQSMELKYNFTACWNPTAPWKSVLLYIRWKHLCCRWKKINFFYHSTEFDVCVCVCVLMQSCLELFSVSGAAVVKNVPCSHPEDLPLSSTCVLHWLSEQLGFAGLHASSSLMSLRQRRASGDELGRPFKMHACACTVLECSMCKKKLYDFRLVKWCRLFLWLFKELRKKPTKHSETPKGGLSIKFVWLSN